MFATNLPVTPEHYGEAVHRFVLADPEALTFQFVVRAERDGVDALARDVPDLPPLGVDEDHLARTNEELRQMVAERDMHVAALQAELDAWRGSTLARVARVPRAIWAPVSRRLRR